MIYSMTGYGSATSEVEGLRVTAEVKSVNNRYLDVTARVPRGFIFAEEAIKSKVRGRVSRGKVDVFITVDGTASEDTVIAVNETLARGYADALKLLSETLSLKDEVGAYELARLPDVVRIEKRELDKEAVTAGLCGILDMALDVFIEMRRVEGENLSRDILNRMAFIEDLVRVVDERSPRTVAEYRERLERKLREVLDGTGIDEQRIMAEAVIYADRVTVSEETVRLKSHVEQLRDMLSGGSPVGRKLDFLVQEMNREANTIGSKCADIEISRAVLELKSEIEKIREQVQNIE